MDMNAMDLDTDEGVFVDPRELLALDRKKLVNRFRSLASSKTSIHQVTLDLLKCIHASQLPPLFLTVWLPIAIKSDPSVLRLVLLDATSQNARKIALSILKGMARKKSPQRCRIWDVLGGTKGLAEMLDVLPPQDTRQLMQTIVSIRTFRDQVNTKEIDALIAYFLPDLLPRNDTLEHVVKGSMRRQTRTLILLLHLASDELVEQLCNQPYSHELDLLQMPNSLCLSHATLLRKIATGQITATKKIREDLFKSSRGSYLTKLVESKEAYEPLADLNEKFRDANLVHPAVPFAIDLLEKAPDHINFVTAVGLIKKALECAVIARTPFEYIFCLLQSIVAFVNHEHVKDVYRFEDFLPFSVFRYWAMSLSSSANEADSIKQLPISHPSRPTNAHREQVEQLLQRLLLDMSKRQKDSKAVNLLYDRPVGPKQAIAYIPKSLRLDFTKFYCRLYHQIDLEQPDKSGRYFKISADLFQCYDASDAQWLYQRLEVLASSKPFLIFLWGFHQTNFTDQSDKDMHDVALVKAELESLNVSAAGAFTNTRRVIMLYRTSAERSSSIDVRREYVCAAIELAARSECLSILYDVTVWSERFLNDPRIGPDIHKFMCRQFYADVLSCALFKDTRRYKSLESLKSSVEQANSVLNLHIDFVVRLSQSSSFQSYNYGRIGPSLLGRVAKIRAVRLRHVRKWNLATAEELGSVLLQSLRPIVLKYESIGLTDEYESLGWDDVQGPLREPGYVKAQANAILPFIDELARERDALWEKARRGKNAEVSSLSHVWPKGLPVQWLLPDWGMWLREVFRSPALAPYVYERAKRAVFFSAEIAQSPLPDDTEAIGGFVDDLTVLIPSYLQSFAKPCLRTEATKLLKYYDGILGNQSRQYQALKSLISKSLSELPHWQAKKARVDMGIELSDQARIRAHPHATGSKTPSWNPLPDHQCSPATSSGDNTTSIRVLDCLLQRQRSFKLSDSKFNKPKIDRTEQDDAEPPSIWTNPRDLPVLSLNTQESTIVAALLVLKRLYVHQSDPARDDGIQYRTLHVRLDDAFLSSKEAKDTATMTNRALKALKWTINVVPPETLRELAGSVIQAAADMVEDPGKHANASRVAFKLVSLLLNSDQPRLASDLILNSLELLPKQSSWHQCVIDSRLANHLSTEDGCLLAKGLVDHVTKRLDERKKESDDDEKPVIKVLTAKAITGHVGELTDPETARSLLTCLFNSTRHSDIRGAVLNSLIDLIAEYRLSNIQQSRQLLQTLVSLSHVAGDPSEKAHISERIWKEAEAGGEMPMVNKERPMMSLLLVDIKERLPQDFCKTYVDEVVLPVLQKSTENCNRWMRIYLDRLPLSEEAKSVTDFGPFSTDIVNKVMRKWREYLPKRFLLVHRSWALSYIQYGKLIDVNRLLTAKDKDWEATNAGKAWQLRWDDMSTKCTFSTLAGLLVSDRESHVEGGITQEDILEECCERARIVLQHPIIVQEEEQVLRLDERPFKNMWDPFLPRYTPEQTHKRLNLKVLHSITAEVNRLRTEDRLAGKVSYTSILPPLYVLNLFLIPFMYGDTSADNALEEAMQQIVEIIAQCAADGANLNAFNEVKGEITHVISSEDRARAAALVGSVSVQENVTLQDSLRIKLAASLLSGAKKPLEDPGVKKMLENWNSSRINWVRTQGLLVEHEDVQRFANHILVKCMKTYQPPFL